MDNEKLNLEITETVANIEKPFSTTIETKVYTRRWLQLGLFLGCFSLNIMQWVQFTVIGNIISRYFDVSSSAVDWTSIIFYAAYPILLFPASYLMNHLGLRWTLLIGSTATSIGAWIKYFAVSPDRFMLVFAGQTVVAASEIFVLSSPPWLAANWFGPNEIATATAIGNCVGALGGVSLTFLITPIIVKNHERIEDIGDELSTFFLGVAVACTVVALAVFWFFQDEPRLPPSEARALQKLNRKSENNEFCLRFKRIFMNKKFFVLWNTYGTNLGFFNALCTMLNPLLLAHFENGETEAGRLGLLMNISGILGSIVLSMILDKTKKFKEFNVFINVFTLFGQIIFSIGLIMEIKWLVFLSIGVIGISTISYSSIGLELSAEATYPEPEEITSGLLNMAQQIYGMVLALMIGTLLRTYGDKSAHVCVIAILTLSVIMTIFTKNETRRQNAVTADANLNIESLLQVVSKAE